MVGKALNTPNNNYAGMSELFPTEGLIKAVDKDAYTVDVQTSDAIFHNVALPIYGYTRGAGLFTMPSVNDWCLIMRNSRGEAFLINTYSFDGKTDLGAQHRENPAEAAYILKSPKDITLKVETSTESGILNITTDDSGRVTMSLSINALSTDAEGKLVVDDLQQLPKIVINAEGIQLDTGGALSTIVTLDMLEDVIGSGAPLPYDGGAQIRTAQALTIETMKGSPPNKTQA
jgi:hypothetical protein